MSIKCVQTNQLSHISRQINAHLYFALHVHNFIFEVTDISVKQKLCTLKMWNSDPTILYSTVTILFCSTFFKFEANLCSPAKICGIFTCSIKSLVVDAREKLSYHNRRWSPFFWTFSTSIFLVGILLDFHFCRFHNTITKKIQWLSLKRYEFPRCEKLIHFVWKVFCLKN